MRLNLSGNNTLPIKVNIFYQILRKNSIMG